MVSIKKRQIKAYILLESLIALGILATITSLILGQLNQSQQDYERAMRKQEVLALATMAVQSRQDNLSLNGLTVRLVRNQKGISVYEGDEEILSLDYQ